MKPHPKYASQISSGRSLSFEKLEDRRLLAITWTNEFSTGVDDPNFDIYGPNEVHARALVNRAIADWEAVITDFNYDGDQNPATTNALNNTLTLNISAASLAAGTRGLTVGSSLVFFNGRPTAATIQMDDNGGGNNWFFDATPHDDAEFTGIANSGAAGTGAAFQESFIDVTQARVFDFYSTILHEIGHAVGIVLASQSLLTSMTGPVFAVDAVNPTFGLRQFNGSITSATLTTAGGAHIYEGTAANPVHPNELMNSGRTLDFPTATLKPTVRRQISDLTVNILKDAYGYGVTLPSSFDTAHVTLDSLTGTLLVQGRTGGLNDTIDISLEGTNNETIAIVINDGTANEATERVAAADVRQIVIARNGGSDTVTVDAAFAALAKEVDYVVSSNEDSAAAGTTGDGIVDLDAVVPGNQVSVRAAIRDANDSATAQRIYVPRGTYELTLVGSESSADDAMNDLDISNDITIIGTGAGATVVKASGLNADGIGNHDRIFQIAGAAAALELSKLTLTGAQSAQTGGAALVQEFAKLELNEVAVVGNTAGTVQNPQAGGGIRSSTGSTLVVRNSVFAGNTAYSSGGAIYADGAALLLSANVFANNTASTGIRKNVFSHGDTTLVNEGNNLADDNQGAVPVFAAAVNDHIVNGPIGYVVTSVVDELDPSNNAFALSVRDAVQGANVAGGTVWLPAWTYRLTLTGSESAATNDLDVSNEVTIAGAGPGLTILDASGLGSDVATSNRIFDVTSTGNLELSRVSLTGGDATTGGAIRVNNGQMTVTDAVFVANSAETGGAIRVAGMGAQVTILRSLFAYNLATNSGAAIYHGDDDSSVEIGHSVFAGNLGPSLLHTENGTINLGFNRAPAVGGFFNDPNDYIGTPDYVVTSIADTYNHDDGALKVSIRESIDLANSTPGAEEIWLPAWNFALTRERTAPSNQQEMDIGQGDMEISDSLTIVGVGSTTNVEWRPNAAADMTFELLGDYNGTRTVDSADWVVWAKGTLQADGDDDGDVVNDDDDINGIDDDLEVYNQHFGTSLTLI